MSYSGNPSLTADVRQRILSTFDQTLELAQEGNRQEALLGCDFVLRMDPQFQPAYLLQERIRSTAGPVRVDDLRGEVATPSIDDPFADLDSLSLDLPASLPGGGALRAELQPLFDQRRFPELMAVAQREHAAVMADPGLQKLVGEAQERMEAEPYVLKFLASARAALATGDGAEATRLLDKARALDPTHPALAALGSSRGAAASAGLGAGPAAVAPPPPLPPSAMPTMAMPIPAALPSPLAASAMPTSLAFGGGDSESDRRIRELLDEGQQAFDGGDPQGAIDAWSRIFLIDIDHQEASRRIESARRIKAEAERQVEEIFHDGVERLEAGDAPAARQAFTRVLEIQPGHYAAREYLQQLDAAPPAASKGARAQAPAPAPAGASAKAAARPDLKEEILVPPEPPGQETAAAKPARKTAAVSRKGNRPRRLFLLVGGAVLLLALAVAWVFLKNRENLFPNSQETEAPAPAPSAKKADPIGHAQQLHKQGKTQIALSQLKRIPQSDPHYAQAQQLIAEWSGGAPAPAAGGTTAAPGAIASAFASGNPGGPAPPASTEAALKRDALLTAARQANAAHGYVKALEGLERANAIAKLDGADAQLLTEIRTKLEPLAKQLEGFRQHEWEVILPDLWRMHEADPANHDVTQMIVDSYYNLAVRDLQRADAQKASEKLKEALNLVPNDEVLKRHMAFAQTYQERPKDLLYRIYVKYLPYR
jgi:tetratricopeptide (TPR) repeat protein